MQRALIATTLSLLLALCAANSAHAQFSPGRAGAQERPSRFERTPADVRSGAPRLGEHTDQILLEIGYTGRQIDVLRAAGIIGRE